MKETPGGILETIAKTAERAVEEEVLSEEKEMKEGEGKRGGIERSIHVNLITTTEMKAHTKEMRSEMDRKFVEVLMVTGLTKGEALREVKKWNASEGRY